MPVGSHADQCDVEGVLAHELAPRGSECRCCLVERAAASRGCIRGRHTHELNAGGRVEEALPRLIVVAILVAGGHITLVDKPHSHAGPIDVANKRKQRGQQARRDRAPRDGQVDARTGPGLVDERAETSKERTAHGLVQFLDGRVDLKRVDSHHRHSPSEHAASRGSSFVRSSP